jgi:hypothetical protein
MAIRGWSTEQSTKPSKYTHAHWFEYIFNKRTYFILRAFMSFQSTFGASRTRLFLSKSVYGGSAGSISARIPAMNTKLHAIKDSMMEIYDAETLQTEDLAAVLARPRIDFTSVESQHHKFPSYCL